MPAGRDVPLGAALGSTLLILGATAPLLIYRLFVGTASPWLIDGVVIGQVAAMTWLATGKLPGQRRVVLLVTAIGLAATVLAVAAFRLGLPPHLVGLAFGGICHAAAYGCLLSWFAASLQPGREPVVTGFARRIRSTMPDDVVRYTRQVTRAWCIFFTAQIAVSATLLVMVPLAAWSSFVSLWNLPLVAAMMLAEFACRLLVFRRQPGTGLAATLSGLRHIRGASGGGQ